MQGVATLRIKQYGGYQLFSLNNSGESIKNRDYFLEFETKFEKLSDTEKWAWKSPIVKKSDAKNLVGLSL